MRLCFLLNNSTNNSASLEKILNFCSWIQQKWFITGFFERGFGSAWTKMFLHFLELWAAVTLVSLCTHSEPKGKSSASFLGCRLGIRTWSKAESKFFLYLLDMSLPLHWVLQKDCYTKIVSSNVRSGQFHFSFTAWLGLPFLTAEGFVSLCFPLFWRVSPSKHYFGHPYPSNSLPIKGVGKNWDTGL